MNHKFILLYIRCINYWNGVTNSHKLLQWRVSDNLTLRNGIFINLEIKHDICSKLHVMFENYMVSTKFTYALFQRQRHSRAVHRCFIKKLFWKISQTSPEHMVIGVLFYQFAGIQLATLSKMIGRYTCFAVNFMKFLRTVLRRTTTNDCSWTVRAVVKNSS